MFYGDPVRCIRRNLISCLSGAVAERVIYQIADASVTGHKTLTAENLVADAVHAEPQVTCEATQRVTKFRQSKELAPCAVSGYKISTNAALVARTTNIIFNKQVLDF